MARRYEKYHNTMKKVADINHAIAVLSWDKEVNLPKESAMHRSQQVATLAGLSHTEFTKKEFGTMLNKLSAMPSLSPKEKKNVAVTLDQYNKATRFSEAFVIRKSEIESAGYHAWLKAREANDYSIFRDPLADLIALKREEADKLKYDFMEEVAHVGI